MGVAIVHDQFVSLATRLIKANGREVSLITFKDGPDEWESFKREEIIKNVIGVQTSFKTEQKDGSLIKMRNFMYLIDTATSIDVDVEMKLEDNGIRYSVIDVDEIKPGSTSILYKVHVKK